jgi:SAM-dependent methyltransferase
MPAPTIERREACRICGNTSGNRFFTARERMFGLRTEYTYFQCPSCFTVQIADLPVDLSHAYGPDYYSFTPTPWYVPPSLRGVFDELVFHVVTRPSFDRRSRWYRTLAWRELNDHAMEAISEVRPNKVSRILDVGCGSGKLLRKLKRLGMSSLVGVDPFLENDRREPGLLLMKGVIEDLPLTDPFDLIVSSHSLEHVPSPLQTIRAIGRHLTEGGTAIIATPIVNLAFEKYGSNWFQIDPPRHLHIFSRRSFSFAISKSGLSLAHHYFDSTSAQFRVSERYERDTAQTQASRFQEGVRTLFSRQESRRRKLARTLNETEEGDQAVFFLKHVER